MRHLSIIAFFIGSTVCAQDSTSSQHRLPDHEFYLGIQSVYRNSHSFSNGFHLGGRYAFNHNWTIQASSVISPIQALDVTRNQTLKEVYQTNGSTLLPWYNHSKVAAIFSIQSNEIRTRSFGGSTMARHRYTGIKLGYQYLQQTLHPRIGGIDYYQNDTSASGEEIYVSGYKSHLLAAGIQHITTRSSEKSTSRVISQFDVLYAAQYGFSKIIHHTDGSYDHYPAEMLSASTWRWGAQASVTYERFGSGHWGFYGTAEIAWTPIPHYRPNILYYAPRGGENTYPYMIALQLGVVYRIKRVSEGYDRTIH